MNTRKISLTTFRVLNLVLILVMTFGSAIGSVAAPSPTGATIASDQADYPPGGTVILTGLGWVPGEIVSLFVNDDAGQTWSLNDTTIAGADGSFIYQFQLPSWFVANYSVTATGPTSGTATTSFTDLSIGTYDQCSNDDGDGYATGDTGCRWINGNLQSNNSTYFEGDATVQRVWLTGFLPGTTHTLTLQYGTTKGGKHAYDFLTTWDWSEDWIQEADRCQGITGCDGLSEDKLDIPEDPNVPNSFEPSAPGDRQFVMRGGDMTSATTPVIESGSYAGDSETIITITFTVANSGPMCPATGPDAGTCGVALWFGAHVSAQANWGLGQGAGSISGSPYHVALYRVDGASVGQRDNQMQANTVTFIPNGTIVIVKDAVPNDAQDFSFNLNNGTTISQDFTLDDDGEVLQVPNSQTFSVPPGTWTASELNIPAGWTLTNLVCNDPSGNTTVDLGTATATINLASLETVTCTFTDNKAYNQDLTVSKTATAAFGRSYTWDIYKNVDKTQVNIAEGGEATFNYTVGVTHDNGTDSGYTVSGVITVSNPNNFDIAGVDISDAIDNGGTCSVTDGVDVTVPANVSVTRNYSCSFDSNPGSGTNTATATWDATTYFTTSGTASGIAGYDFSTATPAISNGTVTVTDTLGGNLGTVSYTDASPTEFTYSKTFSGVAGTCTNYDNTATITETGKSASQRVTVCVGKDLTVSKTVDASRTRTYKWLIDKSVDDTRIEIADGGKATFNYTVTVTPDGFTDSGYTLGGAITINNPNDWQDVTVAVADVLDQGGTCSITESGPFVVPMGDSLILHYTCTTDGTSTQNTATVSWDETTYFTPNGSAFDDAVVDFGIATETNKTITVIDDKTDPLNPVTLGTSDYFTGPFSFTYSLSKQGVAGTCTDYTNTAVIYETNQSDSQTVTVCVGVDLTVTKSADASRTRTYKWLIDKSVDDTRIEIADGGTATFNYTVTVTPDGFTDSGYTLGGAITINNPNDWQDVTVAVADVLDQGGTCSITESGPFVVPMGDSLILHYTCTTDGTSTQNTATVSWDETTYFTPNGSAFDDAAVSFGIASEVNKTITVIDDKTDPLNPVTLGTSDYFTGPFSFTYSLSKQGVAGTCTEYTNIAVIYETNQSDSQTVTVCVGLDLTVSKTATGAFNRLYNWTIDKSVDDTLIEIADGGTATFNYTVDVTPNGFTDSGWTLSGTISVTNPNDWQDITADVIDAVDVGGGASCTVVGGEDRVITRGDTEILNYSCTFTAKPTYTGTNTATATWDAATYFTPTGTASGTAAVTLALSGETNRTITVIDDKTDPLNPVTLGTSDYYDGPFEYTYSLDKQGVAGTCTEYTNIAAIYETNQSDSQTVTVCVGSDLTVSKTATTAFTRTYTWTIDKSVDKTKIILEGANPQSATFNYTVAVSHDSGTDSGWSVSGVITVSNPNDWQDISANVSDLVDVGGGAVCNVESEASHSVTVPADGSVELDYSCSFISKPSYSGLNTATADWTSDLDAVTPSDSTSGTANVNFTTPTTIVDGSVTVVDDKTDPANPVTLGTASYTDASPKNFTYSLTKSGVSGACTDYTNTATFTTNTTATTDSDSQTVKVCSSNITVLKLTKGPGDPAPAVDPTQTWTFNIYTGPDGFGGSVLASDNTSGDADGLLDFDFYNLNPAKTYTLCELNVPSGWTAEWMIDTTGDGTPDTVVIPYNPNANDPVPQDLGNRCFDFGADTSYSIPEGGKLAFQVINEFPGGAPRTPGYWKNWNRCTGGGQAANADRQGGRAEGFTLLEDILTSPGIIWDDILTDNLFVPITSCEQAVEILDQREVKVNGIVGDGRKRASDAARTLAMHLLAAQLNEGNGACINQDVKDVILYAEKLLDRLNFDGTLTRDYLRSRDADYAYALQLAAYLDAYNNSNCNFSTLPAKPINKYP